MTESAFKKQQSILMKENELSEKKSAVKFDESQNVIKEFTKNEKIQKPQQSKPKHEPIRFEEEDDIEPVRKIQKTEPKEEAKVTPPPTEAEEEIPWED